ncbi:OmpP1/FadL family transporter [Pseudooceanicola nanhaiensis]|uniref:OmpP1/FadL family transporter n=1 Tax=Pseudooceanicola nanhaiensis TaxID=375761 RepID=UPI001CD72095|nr:outer membrane protein transport protein [Pseudooceanicola nanhaiensis]MCA0921768.1 outer membrane protein transport protein [Pseudooceanicola nanhaiensis]
MMMRVGTIAAGAVMAIAASNAAYAGGIERTTQSAMLLFAQGNRVELSYGHVNPELTGTTVDTASVPNVADSFNLPSIGLKMDVTDRVALALIYDKPFGADILYDPSNIVLGGTIAEAETTALTALAKFKINENVSVFGGLRFQKAEGEITLSGAAYGVASGYNVKLEENWATGYVVGAAYEIPEIAFRLALTYNSAIEHDFDTKENIAPGVTSTTNVKTPQSVNLEFQTGIAEDTLLMASVRWAEHSAFRIKPTAFGRDLVSLEDTTTYTLGVARRFTPKFAASISVAYEAPGKELVSPLSPRTGLTAVTLGGSYKVSEQVEISGGISHIWFGDAMPQTAGTARGDFTDNTATAFGLKVAYSF